MTEVVLDSSIVVKWFVRKEWSDRACEYQSCGLVIHVPDFLYLEVANVFWKKVRRGELPEQAVDEMVEKLLALSLVRHPDVETVREAIRIAVNSGRTVYDCQYVSLAKSIGTKAVTADRRFFNALRGTEWEPFLIWIEDDSVLNPAAVSPPAPPRP